MELTANNLDALCREAEVLCRRTAPADLEGYGCYVLAQSQLPPELRGQSTCGAYTCLGLDVVLKDAIGDRWRGRGFACVVADVELTSWCPPELIREVFLARVLHELAHAIAEGYDWDLPSAATEDRGRRQELTHLLGARLSDPARFEVPPERPPWFQHGRRWVRAALHLVERADRFGVKVWSEYVIDSAYYGLPVWKLERSLFPEFRETPTWYPLAAVLTVPPPSQFEKVWEDNRTAWLASRPPAQPENGEAMSSILDKLLGRERQRNQTAAEQFTALVATVADGKTMPPEAAEKVLAAAGRTAVDLQGAVEKLQARRQAKAAVDAAVAAVAEQDQRRARIAALEEEFRSGVEALRAKIAPAVAHEQEQINSLELVKAGAHRARQLLENTALSPTPEQVAAQGDLKTRCAEARERAQRESLAANAKRHDRDEAAGEATKQAHWLMRSTEERAAFQARADAIDKEVQAHRDRAAAAMQEAEQLQKQLDEAQAVELVA